MYIHIDLISLYFFPIDCIVVLKRIIVGKILQYSREDPHSQNNKLCFCHSVFRVLTELVKAIRQSNSQSAYFLICSA